MEPEQIQKDLTHPCVTDNPEAVLKSIEIHDNPYSAADTTHAIVICTEWDEFMVSVLRKTQLFYYEINSLITWICVHTDQCNCHFICETYVYIYYLSYYICDIIYIKS